LGETLDDSIPTRCDDSCSNEQDKKSTPETYSSLAFAVEEEASEENGTNPVEFTPPFSSSPVQNDEGDRESKHTSVDGVADVNTDDDKIHFIGFSCPEQ
jgi:hypothetical protein